MHAQLIRSSGARDQHAQIDQIVVERVIPALREALGFAGALSLADAESGDSMLIVLWSSAEHARRPRAWHTAPVRVTVWEVTLRV